MSTETATAKPIALDDVMLAMDVVDTLRHQQSLVDHALNADERDAALTARIRKIYRDQGIEVSDAVIANGVRALRDEQFSYKPPPGGLKTRLARAYVHRRRAVKPIAAVGAALGVIWGAHFAFVTLPEQREYAVSMDAYNTRVASATTGLASLQTRIDSAAEALKKQFQIAADMRDVEPAVRAETTKALEASRRLYTTLADFRTKTITDVDDYADEQAILHAELSEREALQKQLTSELSNVDKGTQLLGLLESLPPELMQLVGAIKSVAKEPEASSFARELAENARAALKSRDPGAALAARDALKDLFDEIQREYQIVIVSRPGERSGVWRYPQDNERARNYYLIVEAVDADGTRLERAIRSEEDGKTYKVSRWGMRVDEATYQAVAVDKRDDGIVQQNILGYKQRGYSRPVYNMNTTGAAIVNW